jgi:hypothetical protein
MSRAYAMAAYAIIMIAWLYVLDGGRLEGRLSLAWIAIGIVGLAHLVFGFTIGRWWSIWLPAGAILLAVPAGFPETRYAEPLPLWFTQAFYAPVEAGLLALGVIARKHFDRRSLRGF